MEKDFLYKISQRVFSRYIQKDESGRWFSKQVKENMGRLYPFSAAAKIKEYYVQKIRCSLFIILAGVVIAAGLLLMGIVNPVLKENRISREGYGGSTQEIPVEVAIGEKESQEMVLEVKARIYNEGQLKKFYNNAVIELEKRILGENESLEHIETDLELVTELPGYPFQIGWECQDYNLLDTDGRIRETELPEEGVETGLNAILSYEDFHAEYLFYIHIFPRGQPEEKQQQEALLKVVENADVATKNEESILLPSELEGEKLRWKVRKNRDWLFILLLSVLIAGVVFFLKDEDLKKEMKRREERMRLEYPEIVSKFSVYLGAGMSVRKAWEKIAEDAAKRKRGYYNRDIYDEMGIVCQEIKSGVSEAIAYDRFGKRCGVQLYRKFSALLVQNIRKGSVSLGQMLKEESRIAFEERKNAARKAGEEAGTKLLLPMVMMLCVVMMMILLPVFISF